MIADIYVINCIKKIQKNFRLYYIKLKNNHRPVIEPNERDEKELNNFETFQLNTQTHEKQNIENNNKITTHTGDRDETGKRNGFGITNWNNGSQYIGQFKDDKAHGWGKFMIKEKNEEFKGEFELDKANGFGMYKHSNAKYLGEWCNDYQNGYGSEFWNDGSFYYGEYRRGKKEGIGVYFWSDGSRYEGYWKDNLLHGYVFYNNIGYLFIL
jgi:hypothetical protein